MGRRGGFENAPLRCCLPRTSATTAATARPKGQSTLHFRKLDPFNQGSQPRDVAPLIRDRAKIGSLKSNHIPQLGQSFLFRFGLGMDETERFARRAEDPVLDQGGKLTHFSLSEPPGELPFHLHAIPPKPFGMVPEVAKGHLRNRRGLGRVRRLKRGAVGGEIGDRQRLRLSPSLCCERTSRQLDAKSKHHSHDGSRCLGCRAAHGSIPLGVAIASRGGAIAGSVRRMVETPEALQMVISLAATSNRSRSSATSLIRNSRPSIIFE